MKANEIQELLKVIANLGLDEVEVETDDLKLSIKRHAVVEKIVAAAPAPVAVAAAPVAVAAPVAAPAPAPVAAPAAAAPAAPVPAAPAADAANIVIMRAPMIGTLYRSASPDKPAFVSVGDEVKKGQTICIIEAMKLFNEIESDYSGRIVEVLVENASPVEYDQALFKIALS